MNIFQDFSDAKTFLIDNWGRAGKEVVKVCSTIEPFNDTFTNFLSHCTACGGDWGGLLLTGIKELYPEVYNAIPDKMGHDAFLCLCCVVVLCGVNTSK